MVGIAGAHAPSGGGLDLQGIKDTKVWDHLRKLVAQYLAEAPSAPMDVYDAFNHFVLHGTMTPSVAPTQPQRLAPSSLNKTSTSDLLQRHRFTKALEAAMRSTLWAKGYLDLVTPKPKKKKASGDADDEEEAENDLAEKVELEDLVHAQKLFHSVGEGLSPVEAQHVAVAIRNLGLTQPVSKVRFWGRIFATKRDYYIAEATWSEERAEEMGIANVDGASATEDADAEGADGADGSDPSVKATRAMLDVLNRYHLRKATQPTMEAPKVGTNAFRYYVMCSDRWMEWTLLPNVEPQWIHAARAIPTLFTGDLDAVLRAHPPFPGRERHYLRAQIARITHATLLAPKGVVQCDDPADDDAEEDDAMKATQQGNEASASAVKLIKPYTEVPALSPTLAPPEDDDEAIAIVADWYRGYRDDILMEHHQWVHIAPAILQGQARATVYQPEAGDEANSDDEDEKNIAIVAALRATQEERVPRLLTPIHCDAHRRGTDKKESTGTANQAQSQLLPRDHPWCIRKAYHTLSNPARTYAVKSLVWPGAVCVARVVDNVPGAEYQNIYIGYGLKARDGSLYTPTPPAPIMHTFPCPHDVLQMDATKEEEEAYAVEVEAPKGVPEGEGNDGEDE